MEAIAEWLVKAWSEVIRPAPKFNVWEYAAEHVVFDPKMGNITGPYRPDLTPYAKLFQEAVTNDFRDVPADDWWLQSLLSKGERVEELFCLKSSQSGLTQAALNACIYIPQFAPGRLLYVVDSRDKAKKMVKIRLLPLLQRLCGHVIADDRDVNLTFVELLDMIMEFGGSFSSGLFSEKPLRYAFADDVEYMVSEGGVPGILDGIHIIDHIRSRFTTADNSFFGVFSKPDLESSQFVTEYRGGSMHHFHVPCPHCGGRQALELGGLNWRHKGAKDLAGRYDLEAVETLTTYTCQICRAEIAEKDKYEMNKAGHFLPKPREQRVRDDDPPIVPRRMSMRINDLNSPFPKVSWGKLAVKMILAENNPTQLRYVLTNHFAVPWKVKAVNLKADQIRALCAGAIDAKTQKLVDATMPAYKRGEIPFIPAMVTVTIDRQGDKRKWIIQAWKRDGTMAVVEYGAYLGDRDLLEMLDEPKAHHGGRIVCLAEPEREWRIDWGLYDSGYETMDVYDTCVASGWRIYPSKGAGSISTGGRLIEGKEDFYEGGQILRYHYNDFQLKVHFYKHKIERRSEPRMWLPSDIDDEFVVEWISESLGPKRLSTNHKIMEWQHDHKIGPNDWGDCGKMAYVLWQILGPTLQAQKTASAASSDGGNDQREGPPDSGASQHQKGN